jgi:CRISPR/Cas system-associated exonuclease Cas4 (RecB family)
MLLEEMSRKKIDKGKVVYLSEKDAREVRINPFVRDEIKRLVNEVNMLLEKKELPAFTTNRKKCDSCGLRQDCFNL